MDSLSPAFVYLQQRFFLFLFPLMMIYMKRHKKTFVVKIYLLKKFHLHPSSPTDFFFLLLFRMCLIAKIWLILSFLLISNRACHHLVLNSSSFPQFASLNIHRSISLVLMLLLPSSTLSPHLSLTPCMSWQSELVATNWNLCQSLLASTMTTFSSTSSSSPSSSCAFKIFTSHLRRWKTKKRSRDGKFDIQFERIFRILTWNFIFQLWGQK